MNTMLNYSFAITELDAEPLQAPQQEGESQEEFDARLLEAKGKHFFRIIIQDSEAQQFNVSSPYFDKTSEQQKWSTFSQGMKQIKRAVVARERVKVQQQPEEKSSLITNGVEQEMARLQNRHRN